MTFQYNPKNIAEKNNVVKKLKEYEIQDLREYCKEQGFSDEQTETFVKNSLERLFDDTIE